MNKIYQKPQLKVSPIELPESLMEWISQGEPVGPGWVDTKERRDDQPNDDSGEYGNLW